MTATRSGTGSPAIFRQQALVEAAGVDPDPDRDPRIPGRLRDLPNPVVECLDVAGIHPDRRAPGVDRREDVLRLEMNTGDHRDRRLAGDQRQPLRIVLRPIPRGVVGFELILGAYPPLSIAAMPPVSLVGLSWAMEPSDRFAYSVRGAAQLGQSGRDGIGDQQRCRWFQVLARIGTRTEGPLPEWTNLASSWAWSG
jgi:hypothetical protein